ncbi:MAG: deoxyhypusine synthase [Thermoplasmata archaeon M9B1D]|nr:MAG: deoxyhypusine synthase [Thermoplasmata archaeon M9B1D]PNX51191.1 MAG: deoxyhypusine synthase [Thermoplasmata archaeon M8B2D]
MKYNKKELLKQKIKHIDIKKFDSVSLIESFNDMAFQSRNLARACKIYDKMLEDGNCSIILCLAGSLVSAGLKKVIIDLIKFNMVDCIVSTGAVVVDQDFFEGLGFKHYRGFVNADDDQLRELMIDRIYDTFIDEEDLRVCDITTKKIADTMKPGAYSSREFIYRMGEYLDKNGKAESFVHEAYKKKIPIFCPAFSDSSAGFGLVFHQTEKKTKSISIDSVADFRELTELKVKSKDTGLLMIGGGVPKNFVQDTVVAADILGVDAPMHKYAVQLTVADERDGALSGSTLKEANSWGKVDMGFEQMVFGEATITFPLLASYAYHKGNWKTRKERKLNLIF